VGDAGRRGWDNRGHFYAAAAEAMRRILIESARRRASAKRGGSQKRIELGDPTDHSSIADANTLLALNEALTKLEAEDEASARLVTLRYFGGLTFEEAAAALGVSLRTAKRNWTYARAWLQRELDAE
jgi:RNA polymerase sigma factor (TIGR02999 family)